jgi:hypothetical protein
VLALVVQPGVDHVRGEYVALHQERAVERIERRLDARLGSSARSRAPPAAPWFGEPSRSDEAGTPQSGLGLWCLPCLLHQRVAVVVLTQA